MFVKRKVDKRRGRLGSRDCSGAASGDDESQEHRPTEDVRVNEGIWSSIDGETTYHIFVVVSMISPDVCQMTRTSCLGVETDRACGHPDITG